MELTLSNFECQPVDLQARQETEKWKGTFMEGNFRDSGSSLILMPLQEHDYSLKTPNSVQDSFFPQIITILLKCYQISDTWDMVLAWGRAREKNIVAISYQCSCPIETWYYFISHHKELPKVWGMKRTNVSAC